jgi:hypothetical protein
MEERVKYIEFIVKDTTMTSAVAGDGEKYKGVVVSFPSQTKEHTIQAWNRFLRSVM